MFSPSTAPPDGVPLPTDPATSAPEPRLPTQPAPGPGTSQMRTAGVTSAGPGLQPRPEGKGTGTRAAAADGGGGGGEGSGDVEDDDSSSLDSGGPQQQQQQELDPFYDEAADEEDAAWADRKRSGRISDAVLSCPGCFTLLCIDCQRHEKYHQQYRAMFVMNCSVDEEEQHGEAGGGGRGGGGGGGGGAGFDPAGAGVAGGGGRRPKRAKGSAQYRRVRCGVCGTEVGALEVEEEMYHFYHVFPSNA